MTDKPLHVRVFEALGGRSDWSPEVWPLLPRYDTDWSATGPLIEKYEIAIARRQAGAAWWAARWARTDIRDAIPPNHYAGSTPLLAVCHMILALHEAGKL